MTTVDTLATRSTSNPWKRNIAKWVAETAHLDTSTQLKPYESFLPEALEVRTISGDTGSISSAGEKTLRLAKPPNWMQRDDLPCIGQDDRVGEPYDCTDVRNLRKRGLCEGCPVRANCLEDAMAEELGLYSKGSRHMVRGAMTPGQRASLARTIRDRAKFMAEQEATA